MSDFQTKVSTGGVTITADGVEWLVRRFKDPTGSYTYHVGQRPSGSFLVLETDEAHAAVFEHANLEDLIEGNAGTTTNEYPAALSRLVCRKLGIKRYKGHPVDEWFRDPDVSGSTAG